MLRPNYCLVIIALILLVAPSYAQRQRDSRAGSATSAEIYGRVRTVQGERIEHILVRLEKFDGGIVDQTTTDGIGNFRFVGISRGTYTVAIRTPGFVVTQQQVDLQLITRANLLFELKPEKTSPAKTSSSKLLDARVPIAAQKELDMGRTASQEKKPKQAIQHLEKAVHIYPRFFEAQLLLGTLYMDVQQWDDAGNALRKAREINPKESTVLVAIGEVNRRLKRYAEAEQVLKESFAINDDSWQGHFTAGRVYWETGNLVKAGTHVGRSLQLNPDYAEAHLLGGNIFLRLNLSQNALVEYQEYLRLAPKGEFAAQVRGIVQTLQKAIVVKQK